MKLIYNPLGLSMNIIEAEQNSVVIENHEEFERFVIRLSRWLEGDNESFFTDEEQSSTFKRVKIAASPFDLHIMDREIQKKLYLYLQEETEATTVIEKLLRAHSEIVDALETLNVYSDFEIDFDELFTITALLKNMNVRLKSIEGSFCARLMSIGDVCHNLLGKDIWVLCNCDAYLQKSDYELIQKWCSYREITVIYVRNQQIESPNIVNEYIIDNDLCILH